jgi:hypothetical protein
MNNKLEVQAMAAAAQKVADSIEPLPLDDEVRKIKKRGWLRDNLVVDPIRFSRRSLIAAVDRGQTEQQAAPSQSNALAQWRSLSDSAKRAVKSLDHLTRLSKFKTADLQVLCVKRKLAIPGFSGSNTVLRAVQREAHGSAAELHSSIIAARQAAEVISDRAKVMVDGIVKLKRDPGEPFRRGFAIEMMKTWWLLTGRYPSLKRSEVGNPFAAFSDAGLQSISADPNPPSCSGVVRSAFPIFSDLQKGGAFDGLLDDITIMEDDTSSGAKSRGVTP